MISVPFDQNQVAIVDLSRAQTLFQVKADSFFFPPLRIDRQSGRSKYFFLLFFFSLSDHLKESTQQFLQGYQKNTKAESIPLYVSLVNGSAWC